jgi:hypothetical protein
VPYVIHVPTNFLDGLGKLWWLALEAIIAKNDRVGLVIGEHDRRFECGTIAQKRELFAALYWWLVAFPRRNSFALFTILRRATVLTCAGYAKNNV